jgi:pimeloyl-ACP methyl ester carboxylesterase
MNLSCIWILLIYITFWSCDSQPAQLGQADDIHSVAASNNTSLAVFPNDSFATYPAYRDTSFTIAVDKMLVDIHWPNVSPITGTILLLPGWSFSRNDWCQKATLCKRAKDLGYVLICPEMFKSIYADSIYPETRADWRTLPTRRWMRERLIPHLQNNAGLLLPKQRNALVGLSTGGRGVALLALDYPDLFCAGVALSGDYNQPLQPDDILIIEWYGSLDRFPERWKSHDNPTALLSRLQVPLYLGHGDKDAICPVSQTKAFYEAIKAKRPDINVQLHIASGMGHDYRYWQSEEDSLFAFIGRHCAKR